MWFPYSLPVRWKGESEREHLNESLADDTEREFLIGFYLHNPLSRQWEVEVQLKEPQWVQVTEQEHALSVGYYSNETGQLTEIICRIRASSSAKAVRSCHGHVSRILGYWSATKGRGFAIAGFRIADLNHDARWRVLPHRPSVESFDLPPRGGLPEPYCTINSLYREARNTPSHTYRFLCCYKIVRLWAKSADPFNLLRARAAELGRELAQDYRVDREMLGLSGLVHFRPDVEGASFGQLLDMIAPWHEWAVQAVLDNNLLPPLDDYELDLELSAVANLLDLAAHRVLAGEMGGWQRIITAQGMEPS